MCLLFGNLKTIRVVVFQNNAGLTDIIIFLSITVNDRGWCFVLGDEVYDR